MNGIFRCKAFSEASTGFEKAKCNTEEKESYSGSHLKIKKSPVCKNRTLLFRISPFLNDYFFHNPRFGNNKSAVFCLMSSEENSPKSSFSWGSIGFPSASRRHNSSCTNPIFHAYTHKSIFPFILIRFNDVLSEFNSVISSISRNSVLYSRMDS